MTDHMTTRQKQIPNRIDVLVSMRGDMSIDSQGAPLNGGNGDIHVEYVRADSIEVLTDEELLKRLRERGGRWPVAAADRVESLIVENKRLRDVLFAWVDMMNDPNMKLLRKVVEFHNIAINALK